MNKTDQQKKGLYKDYWTATGKAAKQENQNNKIPVVKKYNNREGKEIEFITFRHPTLKDLTFKTSPEVKKMTKEEYREFYHKQQVDKLAKLNFLREFSSKRNDLVAGLYLKPNRLKQQAEEAKHEDRITKRIALNRAIKLRRKQEYDEKAPNCAVVKKITDGKEQEIMRVYSYGKLKELKETAREVIHEGIVVDIYSKKDYPLNVIRVTEEDLKQIA